MGNKLYIEISEYNDRWVSAVAELMGRTKADALRFLLFRVETLARHGKADVFGLEWAEVAAVLNAKGLGAQHEDPVLSETGEEIAFDVSLLERGGKSKTGFAGVYATTGNSFRALVPDVEKGAGSRYLPSRKTALQAAIDRYEFFERHALPYGNIAFHVDEIRKIHPDYSIERCLVQLYDLATGPGGADGLKNPFTLEQITAALKRYRELHGETIKTRDEQPELAWTPDPRIGKPVNKLVTCVVCNEIIDGKEPFGPHGKDGFAHAGCH